MASLYGALSDAYIDSDARDSGRLAQNNNPKITNSSERGNADWDRSVVEDDESNPLHPKHVTGINVTKTVPAISPFSTNIFVFSVGKERQTFVIHQGVIHSSGLLDRHCKHLVESGDFLKMDLPEIDPCIFAAVTEFLYRRTWSMGNSDKSEGPFLGDLYVSCVTLELETLRAEIINTVRERSSALLLLQAAQKVYESVGRDVPFSVLVMEQAGKLCARHMVAGTPNPAFEDVDIQQTVLEISSSDIKGLVELDEDIFKSLANYTAKSNRPSAHSQEDSPQGGSVTTSRLYMGKHSENRVTMTTFDKTELGYQIYDAPAEYHDYGEAIASKNRETDNPGHLSFPKGARLTSVEYLGKVYEDGLKISLCCGYYRGAFGYFPAHYVTLKEPPSPRWPLGAGSVSSVATSVAKNRDCLAIQPEENNRNKSMADGIGTANSSWPPWTE